MFAQHKLNEINNTNDNNFRIGGLLQEWTTEMYLEDAENAAGDSADFFSMEEFDEDEEEDEIDEAEEDFDDIESEEIDDINEMDSLPIYSMSSDTQNFYSTDDDTDWGLPPSLYKIYAKLFIKFHKIESNQLYDAIEDILEDYTELKYEFEESTIDNVENLGHFKFGKDLGKQTHYGENYDEKTQLGFNFGLDYGDNGDVLLKLKKYQEGLGSQNRNNWGEILDKKFLLFGSDYSDSSNNYNYLRYENHKTVTPYLSKKFIKPAIYNYMMDGQLPIDQAEIVEMLDDEYPSVLSDEFAIETLPEISFSEGKFEIEPDSVNWGLSDFGYLYENMSYGGGLMGNKRYAGPAPRHLEKFDYVAFNEIAEEAEYLKPAYYRGTLNIPGIEQEHIVEQHIDQRLGDEYIGWFEDIADTGIGLSLLEELSGDARLGENIDRKNNTKIVGLDMLEDYDDLLGYTAEGGDYTLFGRGEIMRFEDIISKGYKKALTLENSRIIKKVTLKQSGKEMGRAGFEGVVEEPESLSIVDPELFENMMADANDSILGDIRYQDRHTDEDRYINEYGMFISDNEDEEGEWVQDADEDMDMDDDRIDMLDFNFENIEEEVENLDGEDVWWAANHFRGRIHYDKGREVDEDDLDDTEEEFEENIEEK